MQSLSTGCAVHTPGQKAQLMGESQALGVNGVQAQLSSVSCAAHTLPGAHTSHAAGSQTRYGRSTRRSLEPEPDDDEDEDEDGLPPFAASEADSAVGASCSPLSSTDALHPTAAPKSSRTGRETRPGRK